MCLLKRKKWVHRVAVWHHVKRSRDGHIQEELDAVGVVD